MLPQLQACYRSKGRWSNNVGVLSKLATIDVASSENTPTIDLLAVLSRNTLAKVKTYE